MGKGYAKDDTYMLSFNKDTTLTVYIVNDLYDIWHYMLGYVGIKMMDRMISHELVPKTNSKLTINNCEFVHKQKLLRLFSKW